MDKYIDNDNKSYYIHCKEESEEYISIKDIQTAIKALKTLLDVEVTSIESTINVTDDKNINENDYKYFHLNEYYSYRDLIKTDVISNTKIRLLKDDRELLLRVNKDDSFTDINGEYITWIKNPIKKVKLSW